MADSVVSNDHIVSSRVQSAALAALMAITVFSFQALFVKHYATNVPFLDEWDEAPFFSHLAGGTVSFPELAAQHNEHRILMARLAFAVLFKLTGEWNVIVFMLFSALLAAFMAGVWSYGLSRLGVAPWVIVLSSLVLASPVQYENMIWGFQIQFYTLSLSMIAGVFAIALSGRLTWIAVIAAILAGFVATFSIASGVLAWVVMGVSLVVIALPDSRGLVSLLRDRRAVVRLAVFAGAGFLTLMLFFTGYRFGTGDDLRAQSLSEWLEWISIALGWPLVTHRGTSFFPVMVALALLWIPIVLAIITLRRRHDIQSRQMLAVFAGIVTFLFGTAGIIAIGRGHFIYIASRYGTIFLLSTALSLVALTVALPPLISRSRIPVAIFVAVLLGVNYVRALQSLEETADRHRDRELMKINAGAFLSSPGTGLHGLIPHPDPVRLMQNMSDPAVQKILPASLRGDLVWSATGDAWSPGGVFWRLAGNPPDYAWGSWNGSGQRTGRLESSAFRVTRPFMAIPVCGYPAIDGNSLVVETVDAPATRVVYTDANPGERWQTWSADVSGLIGHEVRVVAIDNSVLGNGWFGLGPPRLLSNTDMAVNGLMSKLEALSGLSILAGIVVLCVLIR